MGRAWGLVVLMGLSACAAQPQITSTPCAEPRPQVCTMEYAPTCAELTAGGLKEYASPCNACADDVVSGYQIGRCPE